MSDLATKIRIKDIATLAGVSEGTVDRVLHNRGDVSEKSRDAVTKVLEQMNYTPNLFARSLASKKQYRFVCMIPTYQSEDYWESVDKGFDSAALDFVHHNVLIEKNFFNQYDVNSFIEVSNKILEKEVDAVFLAPIFKAESIVFTDKLTNRNIPFSFIDSLIPEANYLTYYGQNSFQSGYIAAKLLLSSLSEGSQIMIIRTQRKGSVSNQTISRYNGFINYFHQNGLSGIYQIINVELKNDDEDSNFKVLENIFAMHSNIKAAITFNSKVHRLANHLVSLRQEKIRLIGYDLLKTNVEYLQKGVINILIAQRPEKQGFFTVRDMCRELIFRQEVKKINYVPIDILLKENIEDYMNFSE
ncbi:MAG: substrate-binding domain-containing protein [Paludibacter sp.]|nr:substrate-binding domain-containing protein [Paludibacter sp.]